MIGAVERVVDEVGHHDDGGAGAAARAQPFDEREDVALGREIERVRRLVEDDDVGVARQRARHEDALPLAAREIAELLAGEGAGAGLVERRLGERAIGGRARSRRRRPGPAAPPEHEVAHGVREKITSSVPCCGTYGEPQAPSANVIAARDRARAGRAACAGRW